MKSMLFRTGSGPIPVQLPAAHRLSAAAASPHISLPRQRSSIRRSTSEPNIIRSEMRTLTKHGSRSFSTPRIPEAEHEDCSSDVAGDWPATWEDMGSPGGGMNKNRNPGGGNNGGHGSGNDIGAYYLEMIKSDPTNSLILRNYASYLHQVEGDLVRAEEYYGRAILASPGDGEVLSLYGKLIWESHRDETRAKSYFAQAIQASPNDCMVLGSYAHFLWEAEEEEDDEVAAAPVMVEAF